MTDQTNATGHTPEPWKENKLEDGVFFILAGLYGQGEGPASAASPCVACVDYHCNGGNKQAEANAARIVQCVNALAGIPDPAAFVARARGQEAAIAELQEMVNVCEMDRNRARAELARLRPLAELYPLAWEECKEWRSGSRTYGPTTVLKTERAHDKARAERGVGQ
jgi:hypothetical protein